jgi:DNA mismatch endonuclease, patch repair protein
MERILRKKLRGGKFAGVDPKRSRMMGRIRSKGNRSTEQLFRLVLVRAGIRGWVLHSKSILGTPDFYFQRFKIAVFIDGCFWHGCSRCGHIPRTRSAFWRMKIERNQARRIRVARELKKLGIRMVRVWEHELKCGPEKAVRKLQTKLQTKLRADQPKRLQPATVARTRGRSHGSGSARRLAA